MKSVAIESLDWSALVARGAHVVASHATSEPGTLLSSLARSDPHDGDFHVFLGVTFTQVGLQFSPRTTLTLFGAIGRGSTLAAARPVRMLSTAYGASAALFRDGHEPVDVALVGLARDPAGHLTLGAAHGHGLAAARRARTVIAEVNTNAPAVRGAPWPDDLAITLLVETDGPLPEAPEPRMSNDDRAIAGHIAPLVVDGACLQLGIGALPSAVLDALATHRALGLHSGMLTPALHRLIERGVVDNSRKPFDQGMSVAGIVHGDAALYRAVHDAPWVALREPEYTHGFATLARIPAFTAINSAIEIDVLGQVNAETVRGVDGRRRYVGGVGGLNEFIRASRVAPSGCSIVATPSRQAIRQQDGTTRVAPRIVAELSGPATVASSDADVFVTEHGMAHVRETSLDERARRLIAIAHPDDRAALVAATRALGIAT